MSQKYFIKTFGCAMNYSDSERIASFLESHQIKPAKEIYQADFVIFNTCGVRQMAEDRVYGQIYNLKREAQKKNQDIKIILTGCVAHRPDVQKRLKDKVDLFTNIKGLPKKMDKFLHPKSINHNKINDYLSIAPKYNNYFQANVPIMTGCNNFCSYCVVPYARGRETSRPAKEIIKEVKDLIKKGYKEITLLGQNVNSYKSPDDNKNLSYILKEINGIPSNFWIRFLTSHPKDMSDELIETMTSLEKICECCHLPIQAGDNAILKKMNRKYTQAHYLKLMEKIERSFQKNKPGRIYALSTDIIVGFPGETKKQFMESAKVMQRIDYDMVYFGQFSPRPGTAAWNMKDNITKQEKVSRERYLNEILKKSSYKNSKKFVGKITDVLIDSEKNGFYYGKTRTLKNVKVTISRNCHPELVEGSQKNNIESLVDQIIPVKITKANIWNLEGEIIRKESSSLRAKRGNLDPDCFTSVRRDNNNKIIVITGPTASGKSNVAIKLARKFDGEIISADSRQIYKGMDIGSGKITKAEQKMAKHYMLDIVSPNTEYSVAKFKKQALKHIEDILSRGKVPIICGGTGFWIKAIVDDMDFPEVKPNWVLRNKLRNKSSKELFKNLKKLDSDRAKTIDPKNKVRLIRSIEICKALGTVPKQKTRDKRQETKNYDFLQIAIDWPKEDLNKRIKIRLDQRLRQGMIAEVKKLHEENKVSWKKLYDFGLEYRWVSEFLRGKISKEEMREKLYYDIVHYAKRQRTWFKKDKRIKWMSAKNYKNIEKEVKDFIK